jgi:hypothetical protein
MSLPAFLEAEGYRRIPLSRNGVGHIEIGGIWRSKGTTPVEAILGVDVFERHAAVIDYGSSSLSLKAA